MNKKSLILIGMIVILVINSIVLLVKDYNYKMIDRIKKEIQVKEVEMTEDGILVKLNVNGELNYYYYED